jgi:hypothetical protein
VEPPNLEDEEYKIKAGILGDVEIDIKKGVYKSFKECIDSNVFKQDYINGGGMTLPGNVTSLINSIHNDTLLETSGSGYGKISDYIEKYMTCFMHNRIGTLLKDSEKTNVRQSNGNDFKKGEICVYEGSYGTDMFCLYIGDTSVHSGSGTDKINVLCRNNTDNSIIEKTSIPRGSLKKYIAPISTIEQTYKANEANLSNEPLETYIINIE